MADSRPRLVTGSPEGYPGHVDGRLRDARLNNPKGLTVDDRGNIYVADTVNNAIRKISEAGVFFFPTVLWFAFWISVISDFREKKNCNGRSHNHCWGENSSWGRRSCGWSE